MAGYSDSDSDPDNAVSDHSSGSDFSPSPKKKSKSNSDKPKSKSSKSKEKKEKPASKISKPSKKKKKLSLSDEDDDDDFMLDGEDSPKKRLSIERIYQKKSQVEHILLRPDTYIGSVEFVTQQMWVYDDKTKRMQEKELKYVPGLYKIFDEIVVNAADNKQRDPKGMTMMKITIDRANGSISVYNNGRGIPVVKHKEHQVYVPTLIFGHLLTSSNYSDDEKKTTGGRNGYGAKLCNIFSTKFVVETSCKKEGNKRFKQVWTDNMSKTDEPEITSAEGEDFTQITFWPDFEKFKMEDGLDEDIVALFSRRAYDLAGSGGMYSGSGSSKSAKGKVNVFLNGKKIEVNSFSDYVDLYTKPVQTDDDLALEENERKVVYEKVNDRWEVAITLSERSGFQQVSFVNSIATTKGGRHVDYVVDLGGRRIIKKSKKGNKGASAVKPHQIKAHMWVFINCLIENPTFDSQTKENMTSQSKSFGSECILSEKFLKKMEQTNITKSMLSWLKFKEQDQLQKLAGGKKSNRLNIPKLDDANQAGKKDAHLCTLIITEGDSAKTLAVAGLSVVGRDYYGVFPLRGKMLNVREASHDQVINNAEITNLIKILGLKHKNKYETQDDIKTLRYGKLMIMTDQDQDGSHIKGLVINFIHATWPSLLRLGFVEQFITPIVKVSLKSQTLSFYSLPEYKEWEDATPNSKKWSVKYYKGLGTSTSVEAKEYFEDLERHRIKFRYTGIEDDNCILLAFSKKLVENRKEWLTNGMEDRKRRRELGLSEIYLYNKETRTVSYKDFINKELILFSNMDNERSIPSLVDGFKPGQRKILFTCFKRKLFKEMKVAQLAGSVSELSAYHHGEVSLQQTIVGLAQNFIGSNNINLLQPRGQFGSRLSGGKDSASARYIYTCLSPIARRLFPVNDDPLLNFLTDDNQLVEPEWYCPIIPMILVNGADGIGTGWSTKIPNYNPRDLVKNIRRMLAGKEPEEMSPWYKGFTGTIQELEPGRFQVNGRISLLSDKELEITELPVRTWTNNYKEDVLDPLSGNFDKKESKADKKGKGKSAPKGKASEKGNSKKDEIKVTPIVSDYSDYNTHVTVRFVVRMTSETKLNEAVRQGIYKVFKCQSTFTTTSMVLFDEKGVIRRFDSPMEILKIFYDVRLDFYRKRKAYLEGMLEAEASKLSNQARFILEKVEGKIKIENVRRRAFIRILIEAKYDSDPVLEWKKKYEKNSGTSKEGEEDSASENEADDVTEDGESVNYNYLTDMKISSLLKERVEEILKQRDEKRKELEILRQTTTTQMWTRDLDEFSAELDKLEEQELKDMESKILKAPSSKGKDKDNSSRKKPGKDKRKSITDTKPSPDGEYIEPTLEKGELRRAKSTKSSKSSLKDVKEEAEDEDATMIIDNLELSESKPSTVDQAARKETKKAPASKKPSAPKKSSPKSKGKQKKKNPWSDSDTESDASMSSPESDTEDEQSDASTPPKKKPTKEKSKPAPKPASRSRSPSDTETDSDSDSEMKPLAQRLGTSFTDIDAEMQKKPNGTTNGTKNGAAPKPARGPFDSDSDSF